MLHRKQFAGLLGEPGLSLLLLAVRTMPIAAGATDPVTGLARLAAIHHVAKLTRFATRDQSQHLAVMGRHALLVLGDVAGSKRSQCIGDGQVRRLRDGDHLLAGFLAADKQLVDDLSRIRFGGLGQMQVDHRRLQAFVAEVLLNRLQAHSGFQQVGGVRVSQGMRRNLLAKVQLIGDRLDGTLNRRDAHVRLGL